MEWDNGDEPVRRARDGSGGGSHGTSRGKGGGASFDDGGYSVGYRGGGGCSGGGGHSR